MNTALIFLDGKPGAARVDRHDSMSEALAELAAMSAIGLRPRSWVAAGCRGDGSAVVEGELEEIGRLAYSISGPEAKRETYWRVKPEGLRY